MPVPRRHWDGGQVGVQVAASVRRGAAGRARRRCAGWRRKARLVLEMGGRRPAQHLALRANRHGVHTSVQALENDIRDWIAIWNDNPRPFTWTQGPGKVVK